MDITFVYFDCPSWEENWSHFWITEIEAGLEYFEQEKKKRKKGEKKKKEERKKRGEIKK